MIYLGMYIYPTVLFSPKHYTPLSSRSIQGHFLGSLTGLDRDRDRRRRGKLPPLPPDISAQTLAFVGGNLPFPYVATFHHHHRHAVWMRTLGSYGGCCSSSPPGIYRAHATFCDSPRRSPHLCLLPFCLRMMVRGYHSSHAAFDRLAAPYR